MKELTRFELLLFYYVFRIEQLNNVPVLYLDDLRDYLYEHLPYLIDIDTFLFKFKTYSLSLDREHYLIYNRFYNRLTKVLKHL